MISILTITNLILLYAWIFERISSSDKTRKIKELDDALKKCTSNNYDYYD